MLPKLKEVCAPRWEWTFLNAYILGLKLEYTCGSMEAFGNNVYVIWKT